MGTTADKLTYLNETKNILKTNLINKKISVPSGTTFRQMAEMVNQIYSQKEYNITDNSNLSFPSKAKAGQFVISGNGGRLPNYSFETVNGSLIPVAVDLGISIDPDDKASRVGSEDILYFIMPAADVIIESL